MDEQEVVFKASVPPISGWIRVGGDGAARVVFDVDDTSLADVLALILWRDDLLEVTVRKVPK